MFARVNARSILMVLMVLMAFALAVLVNVPPALAESEAAEEGLLTAERFAGLELRSIGPALMAGRIADIAIHPDDDNLWYVAVGSGGVWKTENAGVTWTPIFDDQPSYSIGCVTLDPQDPEVIWVGTGENVGGRHVGYGDGIYRSDDGGLTWTHKGLETERAHRGDRDPPRGFQHPVGGGPRSAVEQGRGARCVPDHRRRHDLAASSGR